MLCCLLSPVIFRVQDESQAKRLAASISRWKPVLCPLAVLLPTPALFVLGRVPTCAVAGFFSTPCGGLVHTLSSVAILCVHAIATAGLLLAQAAWRPQSVVGSWTSFVYSKQEAGAALLTQGLVCTANIAVDSARPALLWTCVMLACLLWLGMVTWHIPHWQLWQTQLQACVLAAIAICSASAALHATQVPPAKAMPLAQLLWVLGLSGVAALATWVGLQWRHHALVSHRVNLHGHSLHIAAWLKYHAGLIRAISSEAVSGGDNTAWAAQLRQQESHAVFLLDVRQRLHGTLLAATAANSASARTLAMLSSFLQKGVLSMAFHSELRLLSLAYKQSPTPDTALYIWTRRVSISLAFNSTGLAVSEGSTDPRSSHGLMASRRLLLEKLHQQARREELATYNTLISVWQELLLPEPDLGMVHMHAQSFSASLHNADALYKRMLSIASQFMLLYQEYALFTLRHMHDVARAEELLRAAAAAVESAGSGSLAHIEQTCQVGATAACAGETGDAMLERTGVLLINASSTDAGTIMEANQAACELLGATRLDLLGSHVRRLLPGPLAQLNTSSLSAGITLLAGRLSDCVVVLRGLHGMLVPLVCTLQEYLPAMDGPPDPRVALLMQPMSVLDMRYMALLGPPSRCATDARTEHATAGRTAKVACLAADAATCELLRVPAHATERADLAQYMSPQLLDALAGGAGFSDLFADGLRILVEGVPHVACAQRLVATHHVLLAFVRRNQPSAHGIAAARQLSATLPSDSYYLLQLFVPPESAQSRRRSSVLEASQAHQQFKAMMDNLVTAQSRVFDEGARDASSADELERQRRLQASSNKIRQLRTFVAANDVKGLPTVATTLKAFRAFSALIVPSAWGVSIVFGATFHARASDGADLVSTLNAIHRSLYDMLHATYDSLAWRAWGAAFSSVGTLTSSLSAARGALADALLLLPERIASFTAFSLLGPYTVSGALTDACGSLASDGFQNATVLKCWSRADLLGYTSTQVFEYTHRVMNTTSLSVPRAEDVQLLVNLQHALPAASQGLLDAAGLDLSVYYSNSSAVTLFMAALYAVGSLLMLGVFGVYFTRSLVALHSLPMLGLASLPKDYVHRLLRLAGLHARELVSGELGAADHGTDQSSHQSSNMQVRTLQQTVEKMFQDDSLLQEQRQTAISVPVYSLGTWADRAPVGLQDRGATSAGDQLLPGPASQPGQASVPDMPRRARRSSLLRPRTRHKQLRSMPGEIRRGAYDKEVRLPAKLHDSYRFMLRTAVVMLVPLIVMSIEIGGCYLLEIRHNMSLNAGVRQLHALHRAHVAAARTYVQLSRALLDSNETATWQLERAAGQSGTYLGQSLPEHRRALQASAGEQLHAAQVALHELRFGSHDPWFSSHGKFGLMFVDPVPGTVSIPSTDFGYDKHVCEREPGNTSYMPALQRQFSIGCAAWADGLLAHGVPHVHEQARELTVQIMALTTQVQAVMPHSCSLALLQVAHALARGGSADDACAMSAAAYQAQEAPLVPPATVRSAAGPSSAWGLQGNASAAASALLQNVEYWRYVHRVLIPQVHADLAQQLSQYVTDRVDLQRQMFYFFTPLLSILNFAVMLKLVLPYILRIGQSILAVQALTLAVPPQLANGTPLLRISIQAALKLASARTKQ